MRLAVIPARGGSKRIPRKNLKIFAGKPIISWSIEAAIKSNCFDRVIVSTDDESIAEVAKLYGAEVPFMRPIELSDDHTTTTPVVAHTIEWQKKYGITPSVVCCIYATAPFLEPSDLMRGLEILQSSDAEYVFSITEYPFPIQRAIRITSQGRMEMFQPQYFNARSQDLECAWHDAGQFYWGKTQAWLDCKPIFGPGAVPVILPKYRVQDIDTLEDWERAENMFELLRK